MSMLNLEAHERIIIASICASPRILPQVASILKPEHFSNLAYADIYSGIIRANAVDPSTVIPLLQPKSLNALGGIAGVCEVMTFAPSSDPLGVAKEIVNAYHRRKAASTLTNAINRLADGASVEQVLSDILASTADINDQRHTTAEEADKLLEEYISDSLTNRATGFKIASVDAAIGGLRPGRFHIVAAPSGGGKTTLMVQAAVNAVLNGRPVVYVSGEMTRAQIVAIAVSHLSMTPLAPSDLARYKQQGYPSALKSAVERLKAAGSLFHIVEKGSPSIADLRLAAQAWLRDTGGLLICDYLQIMAAPGDAGNREQEVSKNAAGMKAIATDEQIAVLTGSQLNKEGGIRESEAPLHHSDVLIRIELPQDDTPNELQCVMRIRKNRGGAVGARQVYFAKQRAAFYALDSQMPV